MSIRIITDSPSDIPLEEAKELKIDIVPLKLNIDGVSYREGFDITPEEFYEKLETSKELPTTSTPSPDDFLIYYNEAKEAGDDVIVITLASSLSGTYQYANLAKDMADYSKIHVIDSTQATIGEMLLVKYAVKLRDEGKPVEEIIDAIESIKEKVTIYAMVDTLDYLHKGGRLSKGVAIAGNLLNIKPTITFKNGNLAVVGKGRGINGSIKNIFKLIDDGGSFDSDFPVIFGYSGTSDNCEIFKEKAEEKYNLRDIETYAIGSVIGTHTGPGVFGIAYVEKQ